MDVKATRRLPRRLKTLKNLKVNWLTEECLRREKSVDSSLVAFVRHQFTNYEDILATLEIDRTASETEILRQHFANEKVYLEIKREATQLAERMLTESYGVEGENGPIRKRKGR